MCQVGHLNLNNKNRRERIKSDWKHGRLCLLICGKCLFSNANQSLGKTPCRWKNYFQNNPSGNHWESSYIPWWHYILQLFSSSAVTVLRKEKEVGDFHYQQQLAHPLTAAAVCHRATAHLWGQLLSWWYDNSTSTVQESPVGVFAQLQGLGILEMKILFLFL